MHFVHKDSRGFMRSAYKLALLSIMLGSSLFLMAALDPLMGVGLLLVAAGTSLLAAEIWRVK